MKTDSGARLYSLLWKTNPAHQAPVRAPRRRGAGRCEPDPRAPAHHRLGDRDARPDRLPRRAPAMTSQRDIEVAYVLEDVPGVFGVYAVHDLPGLDYAVHVEHAYAVAAAHYAILRVLKCAQCSIVGFYQLDLPGAVRAKARRLAPSDAKRAAARERVPLTTIELEEARPSKRALTPDQLSVLVVDDDPEVILAAGDAFPGARIDSESSPLAAFWEARDCAFDLVLCDVNLAFGEGGFVSNLLLCAPERSRRVVLLSRPRAMSSVDDAWFTNDLLRKPITPESLLALAWRRASRTLLARPRTSPPVLLVDERGKATDSARLKLVVVRDAWEALERIHEDWALVICSLTMKTDTGARLYSLLWKVLPDIKRRFALLVDHPDDSNRVLTRPLAAAAVLAMLDCVSILAATTPS